MKYGISVLGGILLFWMMSCGGSPTSQRAAPEDLIPIDTMIPLLADIYYTEALVQEHRYRNQDSARLYYYSLEEEIYQQFDIDSIQFRKSLDYYTRDLEQSQLFYDALIDTLSYRQQFDKALQK